MKSIVILIGLIIIVSSLYSQLIEIESVNFDNYSIATGNIIETQNQSDVFVIATSSPIPNPIIGSIHTEALNIDSLGIEEMTINPYHINSFKRVNNKYYVICGANNPRMYCFTDTLLWMSYPCGMAIDVLNQNILVGGQNGFQYIDPVTGNSISGVISVPLAISEGVISGFNDYQVVLLNSNTFIVAQKVVRSFENTFEVVVQVSKVIDGVLVWSRIIPAALYGNFMLIRDQVNTQGAILIMGTVVGINENAKKCALIFKVGNSLDHLSNILYDFDFQHADVSPDFNRIGIVGRTCHQDLNIIPVPILFYSDNLDWYNQDYFNFNLYTKDNDFYDFFSGIYVDHENSQRIVLTTNSEIIKYQVNIVGNEDVTDKPNVSNSIQAFPNPFGRNLKISSNISSKAFIYNIKGQRIKSFVLDKNSFIWDGKDNNGKNIESGIYFIKTDSATKKIIKY